MTAGRCLGLFVATAGCHLGLFVVTAGRCLGLFVATAGRRLGLPVGGLLLGAVFLVAFLAAGVGVDVAAGSHYDEAEYDAGDASDFTVRTYGSPDADPRAPGATSRSYWTESIVYELPEDEPVYLTESITYRPLPSDCDPGDTDEFGIDRGATREGERYVDDDATDSVRSFTLEADVRDRFEARFGKYGDLTTADYAYVERIEIEWYAPDDFGTPLEVRYGDRFVTAQRACLENPDTEGWYRWLGYNEGEFENGTEVSQETPTFSHWYWVCDCEDRDVAVERLGPPPSERGGDGGTPAGPGGDAGTDTGADGDHVDEAADQNDAAGPAGASPTPASQRQQTPAGGATGTVDEAAPSDETEPGNDGADRGRTGTDGGPTATSSTPGWDERVVRTPTASAAGSGLTGYTGLAALAVGLLAATAARRRRSR